MVLCLLIGSLISTSLAEFNPCLVDKKTCVPFFDFDVGCNCILQPSEVRNVTDEDETVMIILGHAFPLRIFDQLLFPRVFREKLDLRMPPESDFASSFDLPETVYRGLAIDETVSLFIANTTMFDVFMDAIRNQSVLKTPQLYEHASKWCDEGECSMFTSEETLYNVTAGIDNDSLYEMSADLFHVIALGSKTLFALSTVSGQFSIPQVKKVVCERQCTIFYWNERVQCEMRCQKRLGYDQLAIIGDYKREFQNFIRSAAVRNFRMKYKAFIGTLDKVLRTFAPWPTRRTTTPRTTTTTRATTPTRKAEMGGRGWPGGRRPPPTPKQRPTKGKKGFLIDRH